ncbi:hypothetical protein CDAR_303921 [Caerostris darwini]|uniref:RNA-binding protein 38 n=1 Tax=Caerostris darwini TaxID=1538125 RepID=A0AAV4TBF2_9ARAC|nr:hypothetical protein CDAR_303921 [Caerostris darwini]
MSDKDSAERAVKDANPIIDGRKANVNLAYLGAKPRINAQNGNASSSSSALVKTLHLIKLDTFLLSIVLPQYQYFLFSSPNTLESDGLGPMTKESEIFLDWRGEKAASSFAATIADSAAVHFDCDHCV